MIELWQACRRAADSPTVHNGVVRVGITDEPKRTVVAFPGTGEGASKIGAVVSWGVNAVYLSAGGRHAGWLGQLLSVYLPLRRRLDKEKLVVCTGYSQGAALALLLADQLERHGFKTEVHAFAAPRPFRWWYRPRFGNAQSAWYRNGSDLVTHLPPLTLFYKHGLKKVSLGKGKLFVSVRDHFPDQYEQALSALEE